MHSDTSSSEDDDEDRVNPKKARLTFDSDEDEESSLDTSQQGATTRPRGAPAAAPAAAGRAPVPQGGPVGADAPGPGAQAPRGDAAAAAAGGSVGGGAAAAAAGAEAAPFADSAAAILRLVDCPSKENYVASGNDVKTLFAMGVGLTNDDNSPYTSYDHATFKALGKLRALKPIVEHFVNEQKRRRRAKGEAAPRVNSQIGRGKLEKWLKENPVTEEDDVRFLKGAVSAVLASAQALQRSKSANSSTSSQLRCFGPKPFMRLVHAVLDIERNKRAFLLSFTHMDGPELDGRNNPETRRDNPWELASATYNSRSFNPTSTAYPNSHHALASPISLSYESTVALMGEFTPDKAQGKWNEMKTQCSVLLAKMEASGSGDGTLNEEQDDFAMDDEDVPVGGEGGSALKSCSSHLTYYIHQVDTHDVRQHAIQALQDGFQLNGGNDAPSVRGNRKTRGSKGGDGDEAAATLDRQMTESNRQMGVMNASIARRQMMEKDAEIRAQKKTIRKMEREDEALSDIEAEKDDLKALEGEKEELARALDEVVDANERAARPPPAAPAGRGRGRPRGRPGEFDDDGERDFRWAQD